jgi:hypothetical protein
MSVFAGHSASTTHARPGAASLCRQTVPGQAPVATWSSPTGFLDCSGAPSPLAKASGRVPELMARSRLDKLRLAPLVPSSAILHSNCLSSLSPCAYYPRLLLAVGMKPVNTTVATSPLFSPGAR